MTLFTIGDIIEGEIETIAFGGEGILRYRNFVVFVPFTAVGDHISCRVTEVKRSFAKGVLVHLKHASPDRIQPLCPYFGPCGGCQLQHLNDEAQRKYKLNAVTDTLKRIGHLSLPSIHLVPTSHPWAYRRHITLHLRPKAGGGFEAGYIGQDNHSLVVVQTCPIFNDFQQLILQELQHLVSQLPNPSQRSGRVTILKNQRDQWILSFQFGAAWTIDHKIFQKALQQTPHLAGILVQTPNEQMSLGDLYCELTLEGLTFRFTPQAFIQNHPQQSANIYRQICRFAQRSSQHQILDLYCGFGITALLLAQQGYQVTGIENNPDAIKFAQENALLNHQKQAHFILGDVEKHLFSWFKTRQASLVVMNPPRQGLAKTVVQTLISAQPEELIYVSCMPATLARDLNLLCQKHYQLQECLVYDMFPQTAHVETLAYLKKKGI